MRASLDTATKSIIGILILVVIILIALFFTNLLGTYMLGISTGLLIVCFIIMGMLFQELWELFVILIVVFVVIIWLFTQDFSLSVFIGSLVIALITAYIIAKK